MNHLTRNKKIALSFVALILLTLASCRGSSVRGTYSNEMGTVLDLRSGGEASMTYLGMVSDKSGKEACMYTVKEKQSISPAGNSNWTSTSTTTGR